MAVGTAAFAGVVLAGDARTQGRIQSLDHLRDQLTNGGGGTRRQQLLMQYRLQLQQLESVAPSVGPEPAREDDLIPADRLRRMQQEMDERRIREHQRQYERERRRSVE